MAKMNLTPSIPSVQFAGEGKVGVSAQGDLSGMWRYQFDGPVDPGTQPSWLTALPGRLIR